MINFNGIFKPLSDLGKFWQEKPNTKIFRWNLFFIAIQISFLFWKFTSLPPQVPLYYSLPWGQSQLAPALSLFILPTISLVLLLINHLFAISLTQTSLFLSRLLIAISLIFSLLSSITIFQIVYIII